MLIDRCYLLQGKDLLSYFILGFVNLFFLFKSAIIIYCVIIIYVRCYWLKILFLFVNEFVIIDFFFVK